MFFAVLGDFQLFLNPVLLVSLLLGLPQNWLANSPLQACGSSGCFQGHFSGLSLPQINQQVYPVHFSLSRTIVADAIQMPICMAQAPACGYFPKHVNHKSTHFLRNENLGGAGGAPAHKKIVTSKKHFTMNFLTSHGNWHSKQQSWLASTSSCRCPAQPGFCTWHFADTDHKWIYVYMYVVDFLLSCASCTTLPLAEQRKHGCPQI